MGWKNLKQRSLADQLVSERETPCGLRTTSNVVSIFIDHARRHGTVASKER